MKTLVAALLLALGAGGAWADPLEGLWRTAPDVNGHVGLVRIAPCGRALCGTLVEATDASGARWTSPDLGRQVIWDTVPQGAQTYRGRVYSRPQRGIRLAPDPLGPGTPRRGLHAGPVPGRLALAAGGLIASLA